MRRYGDKSNPCFECTERVLGCHSGCEKYKTWTDKCAAEQKVVNLARKKERERDALAVSSARRAARRAGR